MNILLERYGSIREWLKQYTRDEQWKVTRDSFILRFNICEFCGTQDDLNVHHILPVRWYPKLELEPYNLITLCRRHHFIYGHFKNWRQWNPKVWEMAQIYKESIISRKVEQQTLANNEPDYRTCIKDLKLNKTRAVRGYTKTNCGDRSQATRRIG